MKYDLVVDRIEGIYAVLLANGGTDKIECPVNLLPREVKEGDVVKVSFEIDHEATKKAQEEAKSILQELFMKNK